MLVHKFTGISFSSNH